MCVTHILYKHNMWHIGAMCTHKETVLRFDNIVQITRQIYTEITYQISNKYGMPVENQKFDPSNVKPSLIIIQVGI